MRGLPKSSFATIYRQFLCVLLLQQTEHFVQMANPVYAVKNLREFKQLSDKIGVRIHANLSAEELGSYASRWGLKHLLAFRLLTSQEKSFLGILANEHKNCPICGNSNSQKLNLEWTESELLKHRGGFF